MNLSEGEPACSKDSALALVRPHLVLDGAVATARALRATEVHVVLPGERALPARQMTTAVGERDGRDASRSSCTPPSRGSSPARPAP